MKKKNVRGSEAAVTKKLVLKTPVPKTLAVFVTVVFPTSPSRKQLCYKHLHYTWNTMYMSNVF